ncbi:MAG: Methyltransferase type 12 [Chloroflexi bacterium]|nr:Methyltransferase type 12 [Chloroflexota bacterium]
MHDTGTLTTSQYIERYGHDWTSPDLVRDYVERSDREADQRAEGLEIMAAMVPYEKSAPVRILDIGSGQGSVAAVLLDAYPNAMAVGLDVSDVMMKVAGERMARYGNRFRYHLGDFVDGTLPTDLVGPFDVVVSARAIHHLPTDQKRSLFRAIFNALAPGGGFFNLDMAPPREDLLKVHYRRAGSFMRGEPVGSARTPRPPTPGHYWETVEDQLSYLSGAGFSPVDCFWKRLANALVGGYKQA